MRQNNLNINSQETDEELAARVQNGEAEAFSVLLERYEKKISRYRQKIFSASR